MFDRREYERRRLAVRRERRKHWLAQIRFWMSCEQCGAGGPLEFHHRDPETKIANVSQVAASGGDRRLIREIEGCDLLCVECHRHIRRSRGSLVVAKSGYEVRYHTPSREQAESILALVREATA